MATAPKTIKTIINFRSPLVINSVKGILISI
jgi:flagellar assembly factor FliW